MGTPMDRRQFLRRAGALTASVGSATLIGAAAGCTRSPATAPNTAPPTVPTTRPTNWAELEEMLSGSLVVPSDPAYPTAKLLFNEQFDGINPAATALCSTPSEV